MYIICFQVIFTDWRKSDYDGIWGLDTLFHFYTVFVLSRVTPDSTVSPEQPFRQTGTIFTGQMPFLSPNQQWESREGNSQQCWQQQKHSTETVQVTPLRRLLDNSRIRQLADWTTRGLVNSRTGQLADATGDFACLVFVLLVASARPRVVQSAS